LARRQRANAVIGRELRRTVANVLGHGILDGAWHRFAELSCLITAAEVGSI